MTEIKSIKFRGKEIKYFAYDFPLDSAEWHMNNELDFIEKNLHLNQYDVFIDIGSAYGAWTLPALSLGATVIAIDPSPIFGACLCDNVYINGWLGKCQFIQRAAMDKNNIWIPFHFLQLSSLVKHITTYGSPSEEAVKVLTMKLDSMIIDRIDLIKIDVEGLEKQVLEGAKSLLEKHHPKIILENHEEIGCPIEEIDPLIPSSYVRTDLGNNKWIYINPP